MNTSPSTSITDVSSTNCTPQHNFNNLDAESPVSCNIIKHTTFGNGGITTKVTTTTTSNVPLVNNNSGYYESVNLLNGTLSNRKNGMANNGNASIDEEMIAVKNNTSFISKTLERRHIKNSEC